MLLLLLLLLIVVAITMMRRMNDHTERKNERYRVPRTYCNERTSSLNGLGLGLGTTVGRGPVKILSRTIQKSFAFQSSITFWQLSSRM